MKKLIITTILMTTAILLAKLPVQASGYIYPTEEQQQKIDQIGMEMAASGYTDEQIMDQIYESVYGRDGGYNTGGRDGLLLNGNPAPNAPGNTGNTGSTQTTTPATTPKPSCNHSYTSEVTTEATCAGEGKITYTCSLCGKIYSESVPKEEHNFTVKEEVKGTCVSVGYRIEECSGCGEQLTIEGLLGNHALVEHTDAKEPTCLEGGYKTDLCTICGVIITTDLPALDHEWETKPTADKEPTCTSEGSQSYHCTRCDETKDEAVVEALGHDIVVDEAPATMFGNGFHKEYCDRCERPFVDEVIPSAWETHKSLIYGGGALIGVLVAGIFFIINKNKKKKIN